MTITTKHTTKMALLTVFIISILIYVFVNSDFIYRPKLSNAISSDTSPLYQISSPNEHLKLSVYFRGGPFLSADYSYVGVVEDEVSKNRKVLFWIDQYYDDIRWDDDQKVSFAAKGTDERITLNIKEDTYDFRRSKKLRR